MTGIVGIAAFLTVLTLSLVITRLATMALAMTGLSYEAARFQARSAFTGTGFTTSEAENVVGHPVRRRIIMLLMIVRSAGLITIILSLILSFMGGAESRRLLRLGWLVGGVLVFWLVAQSKPVERSLNRVMKWALGKWTQLDVRDYAGLLRLSGEYVVTELSIKEGDWLSGKRLRNCRLRDEGVTILGVHRADGRYVGVPTSDTELRHGDTLVLYGRSESLHELSERRAGAGGETAHEEAVGEQNEAVARQEAEETAASPGS